MTHTKEHYERIIAEAQAGLEALNKKSGLFYCGDAYYRITMDGEARPSFWNNDEIDHKRLAMGNVYRTIEAAKEYIKWRKLHVKMMQASDGFSNGDDNWIVQWWHNCNEVGYEVLVFSGMPNIPYFRTKPAAQKAVAEILGGDAEFYLTYREKVE